MSGPEPEPEAPAPAGTGEPEESVEPVEPRDREAGKRRGPPGRARPPSLTGPPDRSPSGWA